MKYLVFLLPVLMMLASCGDEATTPKPRIYPKVDYPSGEYVKFEMESCPFTFNIPDYVKVEKDPTFGNLNPPHPCWFNLNYPMFQAQIYCSYAPVTEDRTFEELRKDAFDIINQINKRSDYMEEYRYKNEHGVGGVVFDFEGPAASPIHFYLTDTTEHFFKGALYFNTQVRPDSLAPVSQFIKDDIDKMLSSFRWTE